VTQTAERRIVAIWQEGLATRGECGEVFCQLARAACDFATTTHVTDQLRDRYQHLERMVQRQIIDELLPLIDSDGSPDLREAAQAFRSTFATDGSVSNEQKAKAASTFSLAMNAYVDRLSPTPGRATG
jgi:hypothetical protein